MPIYFHTELSAPNQEAPVGNALDRIEINAERNYHRLFIIFFKTLSIFRSISSSVGS